MTDTKVGNITHYFDKIGVAVVDTLASIKVGDRVKITGHEEFEQEIGSMQIEHEKVSEAKKGQAIGLKVDQLVKKGDEIYKIE